jgi:hypothetical protein
MQKVTELEAKELLGKIADGFNIFGATPLKFQEYSNHAYMFFRRFGRAVEMDLVVSLKNGRFDVQTVVSSTHRSCMESAALLTLMQEVQGLAVTLQAAADNMEIIEL